MFKSYASIFLLLTLALGPSLPARADSMPDDVASLQHGWARAYYLVPEDQKDDAFATLDVAAEAAAQHHAGRAEPLVWQAIILSTHAKFAHGISGLGMIKKARQLLLDAERIDETALDGSIYTSLGSLYAKSPGWPIAFGDKEKAKAYLERALVLNPDGIDPNFFYGQLLLDQGDRAGGRQSLERALKAPPRPGREDADAGRRAEIVEALAAIR